MYEKFDLIKTPLTGKNLIEASAGTGKTYAVAGLFVRLVVEEKIPLEKILVVTFTKAATEELKDRIRTRLVESRAAFLTGFTDDHFLKAMLKKQKHHLQAAVLIENALLEFDRAAIFTIHGFCQRILRENAFETGILFDTELIVDQSNIIQEIADDFWRKHYYKKPVEFLCLALKKISGPEYYAALFNKTKNPEARIIPEILEPPLPDIVFFKKKFKLLKNSWLSARLRIIDLLKEQALNARIYGNMKPSPLAFGITNREAKVAELAREMDKYTAENSIGIPVFKGFEKFTTSKIEKSTKKNLNPPTDDFFDICDELFTYVGTIEKNIEKYLLYLKTEFFKYAKIELLKRKQKSNISFFDDLLINVKNALEPDKLQQAGQRNLLLQALRSQYSAALLDEFQDTDPIQFKIFSKIFNSKQHKLFMIGDPKQSIYSFRGADIFSYMEAAADADYKYTLTENWRSSPKLITAVNTIFSGIQAPFVYEEINFNSVKAGQTDRSDLILNAPLQLWYLSSEKLSHQDKPINKTDTISFIAEAVSFEIAELIITKNINEADIAVLVRKNSQARIIKEYLSQKNIASVLYNPDNIFDSHEAYELEQILQGIAEPGNERLLKSALVTDIMGLTGDQLYSVKDNSLWWESRISDFNGYYSLWKKFGFIRMFGKFMEFEGVRERLLRFQDGDRRITNILHLAEILQQKSLKKIVQIPGLIKWLSEQRNNKILRLDEDQIRLESDEQSVKIITMHKSKGLEYKVVFCAYTWEGSRTKDKEILFHDPNKNRSLVLDLGSENFNNNIIYAENELLAENLRLLYVALTRAQSLCYLVWGRINTAETSALSYLLHNRNLTHSENLTGSIKDTFKRKTDADMIKDLEAIADNSGGTIKLVPMQAAAGSKSVVWQEEQQEFDCRVFSGNINRSWKISSYSSLISQRTHNKGNDKTGESADASSTIILPEKVVPAKDDIAGFPKGAQAGLFFHEIFEHLDFTSNNNEHLTILVKNKLNKYNFDAVWLNAVCRMVNRVLSIPLIHNQQTNDNKQINANHAFSLSTISSAQKINEMEFYFPLMPVSVSILKSIFADSGVAKNYCNFPAQIEKLTFMPVKGFMKGYIDMVFSANGKYYLIDWKSNFLGEEITAYDQNSMKQVMNENYYILQYHLYAVALHQYLGTRIKEYYYSRNFGGIFYIFIRGVNPDYGSDYGIYFDLPGKEIMNKLGTALMPHFISCA